MSKITVTTIAGLTSGGDANTVKIESGDTLAVQSNATVGGTLGVTGVTTTTGGITIPASTTVGLNFGSGTDLAQLAMQSGVSDRIALRTTHTSSYDNNPFIIYQPSGAAAQNDALVVNTGGQVTKSKNPAFLAYGQPTMTATSGGHGYFNSFANSGGTAQSFNNGGHYDNSTGKFTAPVAGKYMFGLSITRNQSYSGSDQLIYISKNSTGSGGAYVGSNASASQQYDQIQVHFIYSMAANDYAVATYYSGSGSFSTFASTPRNYFYGFLVG